MVLSTITSIHAAGKPTVVAVIDSGLTAMRLPNLCKFGHKDFTGKGLGDRDGHGTNVSGIIDNFAKNTYYCQVILKYFDPSVKNNQKNAIEAFKHAVRLKVDVINFSSTGDLPSSEEKAIIQQALDAGIAVVVPSGNSRRDLDKDCSVYPACYDRRITVIGRSDSIGRHQSGYGSVVDAYEWGYRVTGLGITLSGTSQATASHTGKLIAKMSKKGTYDQGRNFISQYTGLVR
jgi:hypothetical protein